MSCKRCGDVDCPATWDLPHTDAPEPYRPDYCATLHRIACALQAITVRLDRLLDVERQRDKP